MPKNDPPPVYTVPTPATAPAQPKSEVESTVRIMEKDRPPPYNAPQPGWSPPPPQPQPCYAQPMGQPTVVTQPSVTNVTVHTQPQHGGTCPVCHAGKFVTGFTTCGWLCCIFCFPCGILFCCCCMRKKKCNHCGFSVN